MTGNLVALEQVIAQNNKTSQEPPLPLVRKLPPPEPFPLECLGETMEPAARGIHDKTQAPIAMCGQSILAAATLAVQPHARVKLPQGQISPTSSFFLTVAASGERKSAVDGYALWAARKHETNLRVQYEFDFEEWKIDHQIWKKNRDKIVNNKKATGLETKVDLEALGPEPKPPLEPSILAGEPTIQGLLKQFQVGQMSQGLFNDEGGAFLGGYAWSQEQKLSSGAILSSLWSGQPISRPRSGEGAAKYISGKLLAAHLMVQPNIASDLLSDPVLKDQGLLSRFLVSAPTSTTGSRTWKEPKPESDIALNRFGACLLDLLEMKPTTVEGRDNELEPPVLELDAGARQVCIEFYNEVETNSGRGGELAEISGLANKAMEQAVRLAGVLTIIHNSCATHINRSHMIDGIYLSKYYLAEALRLHGAAQINTELKIASGLLDWLHDKNLRHICPSLVYQKGPNNLRDSKAAKSALKILEDHNWLRPVEGGTTIDGTRYNEAWKVVRKPVKQ